MRSAPEADAKVRVKVGGVDVGVIALTRTGGWVEPAVALPASATEPGAIVELANEGPADFVDFHMWITQ